jgi:hypothetical protein
MKFINLKYAYLIALFLMGISVFLSVLVENIHYSQLNQAFAMSFFLVLLILTKRLEGLMSIRKAIFFMAFLVISVVAISTKASIELFETFIWGPVVCFSGVIFCLAFVNTDKSPQEIKFDKAVNNT